MDAAAFFKDLVELLPLGRQRPPQRTLGHAQFGSDLSLIDHTAIHAAKDQLMHPLHNRGLAAQIQQGPLHVAGHHSCVFLGRKARHVAQHTGRKDDPVLILAKAGGSAQIAGKRTWIAVRRMFKA